jgi:hypothetical protein
MKPAMYAPSEYLVEVLEPRRFLSGTGPLVHHHLLHFHQGIAPRFWRHPSHSVASDVLAGQYTGLATAGIPGSAFAYPKTPLDVTIVKDAMGFSGSITLGDSAGDTLPIASVNAYSDGTFAVFAGGPVSSVFLKGYRAVGAKTVTLGGTLLVHTGTNLQGPFSVTKIVP